jgi:predicted DNA-binding transcriptional regulator AlpA
VSLPPVFITLADVCDQLGVSRNTVNALAPRRALPQGQRLPNGQVRYAVVDVEALIDSLAAA